MFRRDEQDPILQDERGRRRVVSGNPPRLPVFSP